MRRGGGKSKGASFEREICKRLSLWVSNGKQEDAFWRSSMSGGRSTVAHAKGKRLAAQAGDISAVHAAGQPLVDRFLIELKFYKSLDYIGLLKGTGKLVEFWAEVRRQADRYGKKPMLIAKQNQQPIVVCLRPSDYPMVLGLRPTLTAPKLGLRIFLLDEFLIKAKPP